MTTTVRAQYNRWAQIYDWFWQRYTHRTLSALCGWLHVDPDDQILDVACGTGELERLLVNNNPLQTIIGVDLSEEMLHVAKEKLQAYPHVQFKRAEACALPFENNRFDLVVCASALHYFENPSAALQEMKRVAAPNGRVVVMAWRRDYLACQILDLILRHADRAYHRSYTESELRTMMRSVSLRVNTSTHFRFGLVWDVMIVDATVTGGP